MDPERPDLPQDAHGCHEMLAALERQNAELRQQLTHAELVPEYLPFGTASAFQSLTVAQRSALAELLPDRWLAAHTQHLLTERADELDAAQKRRRHRRALRRAATRQ